MNKVAYKVLQQKVLEKAAKKVETPSILSTLGDSAKSLVTNPELYKDLGVGALTGAGVYTLSGLLPNADKIRKKRIIAALVAGGTTAALGSPIRQKLSDITGLSVAQAERELREAQDNAANYRSPLERFSQGLREFGDAVNPVTHVNDLVGRLYNWIAVGDREKLNKDVIKAQEKLLAAKRRRG